jgi:plastocyanin
MSHDDHNKEPIILTSGARLGKGLIIVVAMLAIGAGILLPFFDDMYANPPPVTQIQTEEPEEPEQPAEAGTTPIAMLKGAATQGSPDYDPDTAEVPLGNKIVWENHDTVPHTATAGTGPDDPNSGKPFDTGIVLGGEKSDPVDTASFAEGDEVDYYCSIHPYMTSTFTVTAKSEGGAAGEGAAGGPTINIQQGAATQGSPDYDPDPLEVTKGDVVNVVNKDAVPHTVTSGTGASDANAGNAFDSDIIMGKGTFKLETAGLDAGDYDYFCIIHPYMTGKLTVK